MRRASGIALACTIGLLLPARSQAQSLSATEITRETIQAATGAQPRTQVEPSIAVDPNNPLIVVAVVQQGRFADGGATAIGYATSHDGGQTWVADDLPLLTVATGGPFERASDPAVAFGPDGAVYAESLVFGGPRSGVAVQRSDDGGLTFGAPVLAQDDNDANLFNDKEWIAVDTFASSPHRGRVYVAWDQGNSLGQPILLRFSDDRAQTWSSLITVSSATAGGIGALPLVRPSGALTIVYEDFSSGDNEVAQTSHNGGLTFDPAVTINSFQGGALPDIRSGGLPAAAVDPQTGNLYVVWEDRRFRTDGVRDIVISRSTDGASWSPLARVNADSPRSRLDHFTPAVAAVNGTVHVVYRTRDTSAGLSTLVDMRYVLSEDSGVTFGTENIVGDPTDLRFAAQTTTNDCGNPPCYFLGDYMGVAASALAAHPVWCRAFQDPAAPTARNQSTWSSRVVNHCGNGIRDDGEQCDGSDASACPDSCQSDCTCPCTDEVADPKAMVTVTTRREAGALNVRLVIPLGTYAGEAVAVRLDDTDSTPIVQQTVGALTPKGRTGKVWEYKVTPKGLQRVTLTSLSPRQPGMFRVVVKAANWFTASAANQSAADTHLTLTFGSQCFAHDVKRKAD